MREEQPQNGTKTESEIEKIEKYILAKPKTNGVCKRGERNAEGRRPNESYEAWQTESRVETKSEIAVTFSRLGHGITARD